MNKRQVSVGIGLSLGLWLSGAAQGFELRNNAQVLEERLELSAHIDMGSTLMLPVQVISQTPLFQQVAYDARRHRFEDMGIALRAIGEQNSQPLLLEIVNDQYQCASLSQTLYTPFTLAAVNQGYRYGVETGGRSVARLDSSGPRQHRFEPGEWQRAGDVAGIAANRFILDFYLRVVLPELSQVPVGGVGVPIVCSGQVTLLVSVPL
ncbi:DUF3187 domain-containing protein [Edwardsiella anguillarum]|uniref:hypothetical protein n=1 Tax=Edwardsiella TaxID=635 RepID=UPI0005EE305A|nr:hypothetical protein [Edwardsiella anguillarum]AKM47265.1 hypothetical protein QY76_07950 [Edwardsiella sp. EA181011]RFT03547.1 hypothetical protein CGL57_10265 [Edwardsiella anguillarum]BET81495.1 DUF3187 domain-containing protein [Edwardsiella anguillarum]BET84922.1 DUF3187 domain-containing protein [Edwardsiella anguillarum]BET88287.1 DUF3187 domain-containing protein [Edwardsiella anguillarum]